jgi:hypothetical protein
LHATSTETSYSTAPPHHNSTRGSESSESRVKSTLRKRRCSETEHSGRQRRSMATSRQPQKFPCPIFEDETKKGLPHQCNGRGGNTMSDLRRHLLRPSKGRPAHLAFLERCATCNDDILDKSLFNSSHGPKCNNPHPIRKGDEAVRQYEALCTMILDPLADDPKAPPGK